MTLLRRKHLFHLVSILLVPVIAGMWSGQPALAQSSIDVVLHFVEGAPATDKIAYDVTAYVSVTDSEGNPIQDLKPEDFTVAEDSQKVNVLRADLAADAPINLVLLLDTSGSMSGAGIAAAKEAASNFIAGLGAADQVALVRFDETIQTLTDFTTDHRAAQDQIAQIDATHNAGTCLYDAAYEAAQMTATVASGRRAVVLFTDGVDELRSGGTCSVHDLGAVVDLAAAPGTRTPIYTLGMGGKVDQKSLQRLAQDTGGQFLYSPNANELEGTFSRLAETLRSQYAIQYSSSAGPGAHTLAVTVKYNNAQDTDTRGFLLPNFPLRLTFVEPAAGQKVNGMTNVKVETFGQGETIQSVIFQINGATVATAPTTPYQAQIDFTKYSGDMTIVAIAQGAGGIELARASQTVSVGTAPGMVTPTPVGGGGGNSLPSFVIFLLIGGALLLGLVLLVFLVLWILRVRRERERDREWDLKVGGIGEEPTAEAVPAPDLTMDARAMSPDALARLTVLTSDDPTMLGQHFEIMGTRTTLGRKADNDIIFPKDSPVSRHHAVIEERKGGMFLGEITDVDEKTGNPKSPTYGTFVNGEELRGKTVLLKNGDEIRLGKRVRLKFEAGTGTRRGEDKTLDNISKTGAPEDKTLLD